MAMSAATKGRKRAGDASIAALKLVSVKSSTRAGKKLMATFSDGTVVHFGAKGYSDFTMHKDEARKERYLARHKTRENWTDPKSGGALSRWILWNKTSLEASIRDFKKRFNL